mmetsp:Transcript_70975/g.124905  ORF Transcript_70975/g.124905 Transcript_70975/m.124905 type:complete len:223 (+) Transcript_70975:80-748(+)
MEGGGNVVLLGIEPLQLLEEHLQVGLVAVLLEVLAGGLHLLLEDLRLRRHGRAHVALQELQFPAAAEQSVRLARVHLIRLEGVDPLVEPLQRLLVRRCVVCIRVEILGPKPVDEDHRLGVTLEQVVHQGHQKVGGGRRAHKGQARGLLDEAGHEVRWKPGGGHDEPHELQEAGPVAGVQHVRREQGVQAVVQIGVVQIVLRDEDEEPMQRVEGIGASKAEGV